MALLISCVLLVVHPDVPAINPALASVIRQRQTAKSLLYLLSLVGVLPAAALIIPRVADRVAAGPARDALPAIAALLAGTFAGALVFVRLSSRFPWGDGLGVLLAAVVVWSSFACGLLLTSVRRGGGQALARLSRAAGPLAALAALGWFATVLCVTTRASLRVLPLAVGAVVAAGILASYERRALPRLGRLSGGALDLLVVLLLLLAIPDTIIFTTTGQIPSAFFPPGVIQFQQDWILGPTNQLLAGGAVLVNVPASQYGVGLLYFLAGWFHIAPIGYGTFGFLDGILTALVYVTGYLILRIAGVSRLIATAALAVGVASLIYSLLYPVGALPEQGPLRFGLPMALVLALVAGQRWPRYAHAARVAALLVLGVSAVWALENFAYTAFTFAAMSALLAWLRPPGTRRRFILIQAGLAIGACVCAHLLLILYTLLDTGSLPHWSRYLAYLRSLLLGGSEGEVSYGFANWSPGLAVAALWLSSAIALVLLIRRAPELLRTKPVTMVALAGTTAYSIAAFSYGDNRSSTYLLNYIVLPVLLTAVLWLSLWLRSDWLAQRASRAGALAFCLGVSVVLISAAWPSIGVRFSRSMLAHAYPGGGLRAAIHRLWHPPPIDPRAPEGVRLVRRYLKGRKVLVVLPKNEDLSTEILMRAGRAERLFIGFGDMDGFVPSVWQPVISQQLGQLHAGDRLLTDDSADPIIRYFSAHRSIDPITHPIDGGAAQEEWILTQIAKRFTLRPLLRAPDGLIVAQLVARA